MSDWISEAIFYHIYPLGLCGAPLSNDFTTPVTPRLDQLYGWLDHICWLGANALYLGPLFESGSHGYDTVDYYHVDRRLGSDETLARLSTAMHTSGLRLVLDGVFNHVGRNFWAFRDVQINGERSAYRDWFANLRFDQSSPYHDPFHYEGWNGHYELVKLNLTNPAVKEHLLGAVGSWIRDFQIDGLRLDAADCLDFDFMKELAAFCRGLKPDFWLMGEVIHGDYRRWVNPHMLDSVTNYEVYKSLYSSQVDHNYFEIAYALNRQFGPQGLYQGLPLYAFADNHDVDRVASSLSDPSQLYPLYCLLFCLPGVPSIYYGSEWGLSGKRTRFSDLPLRPSLNLQEAIRTAPQPNLPADLARLARIRKNSSALREGNYRQLLVQNEQLVFVRQAGDERVMVAVNASREPVVVRFTLPMGFNAPVKDLLNPDSHFSVTPAGEMTLEIPGCWAKILEW